LQTNKKSFVDVAKRMIFLLEFIQIGIANSTILKKSGKRHTYGSNAAKIETRIAISNIKKRVLHMMEKTSFVRPITSSEVDYIYRIIKLCCYKL